MLPFPFEPIRPPVQSMVGQSMVGQSIVGFTDGITHISPSQVSHRSDEGTRASARQAQNLDVSEYLDPVLPENEDETPIPTNTQFGDRTARPVGERQAGRPPVDTDTGQHSWS